MKKKLISLFLVLCLFVSLLPMTAFAMQVTVGISAEEQMILEVEPIDLVSSVKAQIQDQTGIPADQQILLHEGKEMEENRTLADYNIQRGDTIQLTIRSSETEDKVTVTFDSQGGSAVDEQTVTVGDLATKPVDPVKPGYSFVSWYKEREYQTEWNFDTDTVTEGITLYAKWTAEPNGGGTPPVLPIVPDDPPIWENPFTDVKETDWYYKAVQFANESSLLFGTGEKTFAPEIGTTRGMLATVIYRLAKEPEAPEGSPFSDVELGRYYTEPIAWAAENKIVYGYGNGKYGPDGLITREQLTAILWRYAGSPESTGKLDDFTDASKASNYAVPALRWAVEQEIVSGKGNGVLDPRGKATRAEVAAMLMRYCERAKL